MCHHFSARAGETCAGHVRKDDATMRGFSGVFFCHKFTVPAQSPFQDIHDPRHEQEVKAQVIEGLMTRSYEASKKTLL